MSEKKRCQRQINENKSKIVNVKIELTTQKIHLSLLVKIFCNNSYVAEL